MVLNPLGNPSLHPNSRTNDAADPMIILERCAFRSLASRGDAVPSPGRGATTGKMVRRAKERGCSEKEGRDEWHESRRRKRERRTMAIAPTEAKSIDRSQARRSKPIAPTEANWSTEVICTETIASRQTKPIAPNEAKSIDRSQVCRSQPIAPTEANWPGGMPTSSWACCREPDYEHAHEDVGMPPGHPAIARIRGMVSRTRAWSRSDPRNGR